LCVGKIYYLYFITVETQQSLYNILVTGLSYIKLTYKATCFGHHAAIIGPVKKYVGKKYNIILYSMGSHCVYSKLILYSRHVEENNWMLESV
jgi:hypothetical protein